MYSWLARVAWLPREFLGHTRARPIVFGTLDYIKFGTAAHSDQRDGSDSGGPRRQRQRQQQQ
jgi:hypothetical protein